MPKQNLNLNQKPVNPVNNIEAKPKIGSKLLVSLVEATGISSGYSNTVAWFAERLMLASFLLAVLSFAAGSLFVLKLSDPISDSIVYNAAAVRAQRAEEGIKVFSQQVIDVASPVFGAFVKDNRDEVQPENDQVAIRKEKLRAYLESKKSPFAKEETALDAFAESRNMKMMVAISFVESTFGKNCYYFNCSGIGGTPPKLRKYNNYAEWIKDFDDLLERRYKDVPPEDFIGLYVQPGSPNWIHGVKQVLREFDEQGIAKLEAKPRVAGESIIEE
jgi:hypothetical protein